ncbi:hypothetical protein AGMMS49960_01000 [Betaproteobacteria bacterium]|nr:hypothetical protein AGMMS49543_22450 [Betaproteobacteria bacterium]GHT98273.1 hypothetical protein AGMMS49960_01000 [Betaproteobacteria bacterium]GHU23149.1 hypothetical protein AGMMS50243_24030 [Betaproteobacteria bacterium]
MWLLLCCGLAGFVLWKAWPVGRGIYGFFTEMSRRKSLPDPVVVKDGVYWFPLGDKVFAVPKTYVRSYGRNSTDGSLNNFSLHALLPDFQGYSAETAAKFKELGWGDRIEIMAHMTYRKTQDESAKLAYNGYLNDKKSLNSLKGLEPVVISINPRIEKIGPLLGSDNFYLIEGDRVLKEIRCFIKIRDYQKPSCSDISMFYDDGILLYVIYSRNYEKDWIAINDQVVSWLKDFERPLDALPDSTHTE